MFGLIESEALFQPLDVDVLCILCSYVFDTDFGHHTHIYIYTCIYVKSQYMPWMCHAGVPTWRPRRSTGPMAQVPQGVENKRRGRRTNPRSVTWDVHLTAQGAG